MNKQHIELAQMKREGETPDERDLITYARMADPDAWNVTKLEFSYWRRLKSIQAAERILSHESAARSAMAWEEPHRATWMDRVAAWVFSSRVGVAS